MSQSDLMPEAYRLLNNLDKGLFNNMVFPCIRKDRPGAADVLATGRSSDGGDACAAIAGGDRAASSAQCRMGSCMG